MKAHHRYAQALAAPWVFDRLADAQSTPQPDAIDLDLRPTVKRLYPGNKGLLPAFIRQARQHLESDGPNAILRLDADRPTQEILRWRAIVMRLPPGMLIAAYSPGCPRHEIRLLPRVLAPTGPIAHLHLHYKAAMQFEHVWANVARRSPDPREVDVAPPGCSPADWLDWLARARLARLVIARRLHATDWPQTWRSFIDDGGAIRRATTELAVGRLSANRPSTAQLNQFANHNAPKIQSERDIWRADPLYRGSDWPEGELLWRAFRFAGRDPVFDALFCQYLRVRCALFDLLVDDPEVTGLDRFVDTAARLGTYRDGMQAALPEIVKSEAGLDLRSVEARTAPPSASVKIRKHIERFRADAQGVEVGLVYHFIRDTERTKPYVVQMRRLWREVNALVVAMRTDPNVLKTVRGIDIAGREQSGPIWLAIPGIWRAWRISRQIGEREGLAPLRISLHAGEDFRHLASGLRAIHEPIEWGILRRGDRLGHALALGIDVDRWCVANPTAEVTYWNRLLDLLWMIGRIEAHSDGALMAATPSLPRLRGHLDKLIRDLGIGDAPSIAALAGLRPALGNPELLDRLAESTARPRNQIERLIRWRLTCARDGLLDSTIEVETAPDAGVLKALQLDLAHRVGHRSIVVELNPSSNLSIAGFERPVDQPLFRLMPYDGSPALVPVTLSVDDPLQFSSSLADEYAYAWAGLVDAGVRPSIAQDWLQRVAETAWRARFTGA